MSIRVLRPGLLTTVQDLGRPGYQQHGVVVGGAMDAHALRIANLLVGNESDAAGLEITLIGPALRVEADMLVAVCGGDMQPLLDDSERPAWRPFLAAAGSTLTFMPAHRAARCCIAFAGGLDVPVVLGGRGTDLRAHFGGVDGRALAAGDVIGIGVPGARARAILHMLRTDARSITRWGAGPGLQRAYRDDIVVRILAGAEHDRFDERSRSALVEQGFVVTAQSNRMGYRLDGPRLALETALEMISSPVTMGTIQVPADGGPIILMADRQTTGGYPRIAQVITADLPLLAQAAPGARVRFTLVTIDEAQRVYLAQERDVRLLESALRLMHHGAA